MNGCDMDTWLTYSEAGERFGVSAEAIRQRAIRGNWPRRQNNEGQTTVRLPEGVIIRPKPKKRPVERANERPVEHPYERPEKSLDSASERLVAALEAHVATLKAELEYARAELEAERQAALTAIRDYERVMREMASMKGHAVPAGPSEAAVKRAENLVDILQRMRERQATKAG